MRRPLCFDFSGPAELGNVSFIVHILQQRARGSAKKGDGWVVVGKLWFCDWRRVIMTLKSPAALLGAFR